MLERPGHTEAAVDLCRLAGLSPVGVIVELVHDDGSMLRLDDALELAERDGLLTVTIADLVAWRRCHDRVRAVARTTLPTSHGTFAVTAYVRPAHRSRAPRSGEPGGAWRRARGGCTRSASPATSSDRVGATAVPSCRLRWSASRGTAGTVVYLRGHEGRGVGLADKLRAYELQDSGYDTVDAQTQLGLPVDAREYDAAAAILHDLAITDVRLLTNNPRKVEALRELGIDVEMVPLHVGQTPENERYLRTKRERLGHTAPLESVRPADMTSGHGVSA